MADPHSERPAYRLEYEHPCWGEWIVGTKAQLQALGLGVGVSFPGEPAAPARVRRVRDPRGLAATIQRHYTDDGRFMARIAFPSRERPEAPTEEVAAGVLLTRHPMSDDYVGRPAALAAAGIAREDQMPGQPGMRKVCVTILADGSLPSGAPTANCSRAREPGAKQITRLAGSTFRVCVFVSEAECELRNEICRRADREYEARMQALPRPAPLIALAAFGRAHLRLVWSAC